MGKKWFEDTTEYKSNLTWADAVGRKLSLTDEEPERIKGERFRVTVKDLKSGEEFIMVAFETSVGNMVTCQRLKGAFEVVANPSGGKGYIIIPWEGAD